MFGTDRCSLEGLEILGASPLGTKEVCHPSRFVNLNGLPPGLSLVEDLPRSAMNRRAVLSLIAAMPLAACARPPSPVFEEAGAAPYALGTGDKLRVIVFGQDNLSNVYAVDSVGRISMPLVDVVPVAGLTTQQAERAIEAKLRNGFIREPRVAVEIDTFRPFYILGEVVTPGQYPYVNGLTIQKAAAIASGFTPRGDQYNAEITRQVKGGIVVATVPITYPIRPGDTIVIKERWF